MDAGGGASGGEMTIKSSTQRQIRSHPAACVGSNVQEMGGEIFCNRELNMKQVGPQAESQLMTLPDNMWGLL